MEVPIILFEYKQGILWMDKYLLVQKDNRKGIFWSYTNTFGAEHYMSRKTLFRPFLIKQTTQNNNLRLRRYLTPCKILNETPYSLSATLKASICNKHHLTTGL